MKKQSLFIFALTALFYTASPAAPFPRNPHIPAVSNRTIQSDSATPTAPNAAATSVSPRESQQQTISSQPSTVTFEEVRITDSTVLNYQNRRSELKPVSYGIRKKKVFGLATIRVYVIEFLAAVPNALDKSEDQILSSLKKSQSVQLKLTMSRDLSGKKITDSFKESLEANGIDTQRPSKELNEVMTELSNVKEYKSGETFSLLATWNNVKDTTATLFIQRPDNSTKIISGDDKFITDLFAIWFGKPADDKLADLKKVLLK